MPQANSSLQMHQCSCVLHCRDKTLLFVIARLHLRRIGWLMQHGAQFDPTAAAATAAAACLRIAVIEGKHQGGWGGLLLRRIHQGAPMPLRNATTCSWSYASALASAVPSLRGGEGVRGGARAKK